MMKLLQVIGAFVVVLVFIATVVGVSGRKKEISDDDIHADFKEPVKNEFGLKVARDLEQQYDIAKRSGTAMDACTRAGAVAEMYLQAHDEENYKTWKRVQAKECKRAGL